LVEEQKSPFEFEDTGIQPQPRLPKKEAKEEFPVEGEEGGLISFEDASVVGEKGEVEQPQDVKEEAVEEPPAPEEFVVAEVEPEVSVKPPEAPKKVEPEMAVKPPEPPKEEAPKVTPKPPATPEPPKRRPIAKRKPAVPPKEPKRPQVETPVPQQRPSPAARPAPPPVAKKGKGTLVAAGVLLVVAAVFGYLFFDAQGRLEEEKEARSKEVEKLKTELEQVRTDSKRNLDARDEQIEKLKGELNDALASKANAETELQTLKSNYEYMKSQYEKEREKAEEASRLRNEMETLKERNTNLEREKHRLQAEIQDLKAQLTQARKFFDSKVKELQKRNREISALKERLARLGETGAKSDEEQEKRIRELQEMLKAKDRDIEELMSQIERLREGGEASPSGVAPSASIKALKNLLKRKQREVVALQERLMKSEMERKRYSSPLKTIEEWVKANNTGDIVQVAKLYSSTSDFWRRWTGSKADVESLQREFRVFLAKGTMSVDIERVEITGDKAVAFMNVVMEGRDGRSVYAAKMVLVKENDEWKIEDEGF